MKKMRNITKDKIKILLFLLFCFCITMAVSVLFIVGLKRIVHIYDNNKTPTTNQATNQAMNKFYNEERVKAEMYYLSAWETVENMSQEEFENTFYIS